MAKKILIGLGVVLALLAGVVVIAPSFIDSAALKKEITVQARAATGRELDIGGNLEVRLFPAPALMANEVRLSNAEGAEAPDMVRLKAVEVRVALMPLLSGQIQVERIRLVAPVINIEKFADGRTNLEFQPAATSVQPATPQTADSPAGSAEPAKPVSGAQPGLNVRLDNFEVVDGQVVYRDRAAGTVERVEEIDATLRAGSLDGPFEAQGQARVRGVPLAFEVSLGQIIKQRTVPVNAVLSAPGGARAQVTGAVFGLEAEPHFKGKIKVEGQSLASLLDAVAGVGAAPAVLGQAYVLESQVEASAAALDLGELEFQLGKSRITGGAHVALAKGVNFDVQLKAAGIDVDALLAGSAPGADTGAGKNKDKDAMASASIAPAPPKTQTAAATPKAGFAFPAGVAGTVQLTVDALTVKGGLVSDVRVSAELADGELALSQLQAVAPGVTEFAVFGFVRPVEGAPRFEGDVEVTSSDPTSLTKWLGVQMPAGVAGRVKRVTYKSKVAADTKQVVVSGLEITADHSKLTGGVTLALRKRLSFGADLALNTLNLDTYLNGNGTAMSTGSAQAQPAPAQSGGAQPAPGATALDAAQAWVGLSALNDFDANMKVRVGALTYEGRTLNTLSVDGTLYAGTLQLRSLKVGDILGASANLAGSFNGFGAIPEMSKVKLDANIKDAAKLANSFGVDGVPKGLKAVGVKANAEGSLLKPRFDVAVDALKGKFTTKGSFSLLPIGFGFDGVVNAQHGDLGNLLDTLDLGYKPAGPLGALNLTAKLDTDGKTHKVSALKSTLGDTAIDGDITARTDGAKPRVSADLQTGALVLDRFLPKAQKTAALEHHRGTRWGKRPDVENVIFAAFGADELAQASSKADKRWSRERFDLSALNLVDADVTLKSTAIAFGAYKLTAADIHTTVKDGVMTADKVTGNLFGGPVRGTAVVRANGAPTVETTLKVDALQVAQAVQAVAGKDLASGKMSMNMGFNATGLSPAEMVSSLAGDGNLAISELDAKQGGKGSALSGVIGLVAAMNKLSLGEVKKGKGLADLALAFNIKDGVANTQKMTLSSSMGNGTGAGTIDIAGWGIDFAGNMTVEPNLVTSLLSKGRIGRQEVPFSVKGALDNPGVKLGLANAATGAGSGAQQKLDPLKGLLQKALPGLKLPEQKPAQEPAQPTQGGTLAPPPPKNGATSKPQKPSAEDIIKQLMKGL